MASDSGTVPSDDFGVASQRHCTVVDECSQVLSPWFAIYSVLLQPTVAAATGLFIIRGSAGDIALALVGDASLVTSCLGCARRMQQAGRTCGGRRCHRNFFAASPTSSLRASSRVPNWIAARRVVWVPNEAVSRTAAPFHYESCAKKRFCYESPFTTETFDGAEIFALQFDIFIGRIQGGSILRQVFLLFGFTWSFATGVAGALDPRQPSSCLVAQIVLLCVAALSLVILVVVRPYASPVDLAVNVCLESLSLLTAVLSTTNIGGSSAVQTISYVQLAVSALMTLCRLFAQRIGKGEEEAVVAAKEVAHGHRPIAGISSDCDSRWMTNQTLLHINYLDLVTYCSSLTLGSKRRTATRNRKGRQKRLLWLVMMACNTSPAHQYLVNSTSKENRERDFHSFLACVYFFSTRKLCCRFVYAG